jgi:NMD protein affecting ribosome stability and mRNA decay
MSKCENCGKEVESFITVWGQKLCVECAVKQQKDIDPNNPGYTACI